jgi:membrane protein DedA with SNARE-associated domain
MTSHIFDLLRHALVQYGYWAVAVTLLLENTGLPLPGETILLLASFLAYSEHSLRLPWIIVVGIVAATAGDNLGYILGHRGGRALLERYRNIFRIRAEVLERGERMFARYGAVTVFFARFVFGLRIIAGPLAGVLRMPWRKFVVFNFLGAALWVSVISAAGYLFGRHWARLLRNLERFNIAIAIVALFVAGLLWWRSRRNASSP